MGSLGNVTTVTTRFAAAELATMKETAMADLAGTERWVSTNDALTAHLWKVLGELRDRPDASEERLGLIADFRSFAGDAIPDDYWGDAITQHPARNARRGRTARPPSRRGRRGGPRGPCREDTEERIREETAFLCAERDAGRFKRVMNTMGLDAFDSTIAIDNWSKLPFYRIDFGQGTPFWYDFTSIPIPWTVHIAPTPANRSGPRDVHMALPPRQARALQEPSWASRFPRVRGVRRDISADFHGRQSEAVRQAVTP
ncbi:Transferase OS=Streptomyces antimycoticus OX=68175 GN=SANT12839_056120 PE=4 SV=1 [Streptomyces antimycoticus]